MEMRRYVLTGLAAALVAAPPAAGQTLPIDPGKPGAVEKRQVIRKAKPAKPTRALPVRRKPPLDAP
jgi:hypothetical protein